MMVKLNKLGIKEKMWEIIDNCHCDTESLVYVNGSMSRWVEIKQGVRHVRVVCYLDFYIVCLLMIC